MSIVIDEPPPVNEPPETLTPWQRFVAEIEDRPAITWADYFERLKAYHKQIDAAVVST
jgi:hypothetical protein